PKAPANDRWVGICWPRTRRPLAISVASASTMRRNTGPCRSDNVGTQSIQFLALSVDCMVKPTYCTEQRIVKELRKEFCHGAPAASLDCTSLDRTGLDSTSPVAGIQHALPELRERPVVRRLPESRRPLRGLRRGIFASPRRRFSRLRRDLR